VDVVAREFSIGADQANVVVRSNQPVDVFEEKLVAESFSGGALFVGQRQRLFQQFAGFHRLKDSVQTQGPSTAFSCAFTHENIRLG
jgi:hypothetical protein